MKKSLFTLLSALVVAAFAASAGASPQIGQPAPDFTVIDTAGVEHSLTDFAGQTVILEWTNHECPFVKKHYSSDNMQNQQRMARDKYDVVWLSVISSKPGAQGHVSPQAADALTVNRKAAPAAVLLDESGDMGRAYDARVTPHMYIIDADGDLQYMGGIDSNPSSNPADIPAATQYVVAALAEMADGSPISETMTRPYGCTIKY